MRAVAKYCNERVCVSANIASNQYGRSLPIFLCMLPLAVARFSSGGVMQSQGEGAILGGFFPIDTAFHGPYSSMNFAVKDRFRLNLLLGSKVGQNSISNYYTA